MAARAGLPLEVGLLVELQILTFFYDMTISLRLFDLLTGS